MVRRALGAGSGPNCLGALHDMIGALAPASR